MEQYTLSPLPVSSEINLLVTPENANNKHIQGKSDGESNGSILNDLVSMRIV